jgi:uncharacterized protein YoxC
MEAATLKIILDLKEQNMEMRRAITDATDMLTKRCKLNVDHKYKETSIAPLITAVNRAVAELNNKAKPAVTEEDPL